MRTHKAQRALYLSPAKPRGWSDLPPMTDWRSPTFAEFVAQVEHEFGGSVDVSRLFSAGLGSNEHLSPDEVKALCGQLGVPAEDFGV